MGGDGVAAAVGGGEGDAGEVALLPVAVVVEVWLAYGTDDAVAAGADWC